MSIGNRFLKALFLAVVKSFLLRS